MHGLHGSLQKREVLGHNSQLCYCQKRPGWLRRLSLQNSVGVGLKIRDEDVGISIRAR